MKSKMMRTLLLGILALMLSFTLIACNDGSGGGTGGDEPVVCTVTFDVGAGTLVGESTKQVTKGEAIGKMPNCTPQNGYDFDGWYDSSGTQWSETTVFNGTENFTLTAEYLAIAYSIEYHLDGGEFTDEGLSEFSAYTIEDAVTLPDASKISKIGHTFSGWYDNDDFDGEAITSIAKGSTGDREFYADYTVNSYTVTASQSVEDMFNITAAQTATFGTDYTFTVEKLNPIVEISITIGGKAYTLPTPEPNPDGGENYTILGNDIIGDIVIIVDEPVSVTAPQNESDGFTFTGELLVVKNGTYTFTVVPDTGYKIISVKIDDVELTATSANEYTYKVGTTDFAIVVEARPISYSIAFDKNDSAGSTQSTGTAETISDIVYDDAQPTNLPDLSNTRENYTFLGWAYASDASTADFAANSLNDIGNIPNVTDGETVTLYAVWKANSVNVTFSAIGRDSVWGPSPADTYQAADPNYASLTSGATTAAFDTNYVFNHPTVAGYTFTVSVTIGGTPYTLTNNNGKYTISGADITGAIVITIEKHVDGISELDSTQKTYASYTYTDGDGIYDHGTSNGNSVKYEGVLDASGNIYIRVTATTTNIDEVGNQGNSDQIQVWFRDSSGTHKNVYVGLSGAAYSTFSGSSSLVKWVAKTSQNASKYVSVFELHIPASLTASYVSNSEVNVTLSYVTKASNTNVFAGKAINDAEYWAIFGTTVGNSLANPAVDVRAGFGYGSLLTANGVYDYNGQAKLRDNVVIDGDLTDSKWASTTGVQYNDAGSNKIVYKGFTGEEGVYLAAVVYTGRLNAHANNGLFIRLVKATGIFFNLRYDGMFNGYHSYGTGAVSIVEGSGYCILTFEAYIPYSALDTKRSDFSYTKGDVYFDAYYNGGADNNFSTGWRWRPANSGGIVYQDDVSYLRYTSSGLTDTLTPNTYAHAPITFNANGGSVDTSIYTQPTVVGAALGTLPTPSKAGYTFTGWYTQSSGGDKVESTHKLALNEVFGLTLYAQWNLATYNVTGLNGSDLPESVADKFTISTLTTSATHLTPYTFKVVKTGAAASDDGVAIKVTIKIGGTVYLPESDDSGNYTIAGNHITGNIEIGVELIPLVAYEITFNGNGATSGSMSNQSVYVDFSFELKTNAYEKNYHTFAGWATEQNGEVVYTDGVKIVTNLSTDETGATLYAVWTANKYDVEHKGIGNSIFIDGTQDGALAKYNPNFITNAKAGADKATYNTDYTFTVVPETNYVFEVTAKIGSTTYKFDGTVENFAAPVDNLYTIPGASITGDLLITVEKYAFDPNVLDGAESVTYTDSTGNGNSMTFTAVKTVDAIFIRAVIVTTNGRILANTDDSTKGGWADNLVIIMPKKGTKDKVAYALGINGSSRTLADLKNILTADYTELMSEMTFTTKWQSDIAPAATKGNINLLGNWTTETFEVKIPYGSDGKIYGWEKTDTEIPISLGYHSNGGATNSFTFRNTVSGGAGLWMTGSTWYPAAGAAMSLNADGIFDAKTLSAVEAGAPRVDGVLTDAKWADVAGVKYDGTDGRSVIYKAYSGTKGMYFAAWVKNSSQYAAGDTVAIRVNSPATLNLLTLNASGAKVGNDNLAYGAVTHSGNYSFYEFFVPYMAFKAQNSNFGQNYAAFNFAMGFTSATIGLNGGEKTVPWTPGTNNYPIGAITAASAIFNALDSGLTDMITSNTYVYTGAFPAAV